MALVSPKNLSTLHNASARQTSTLELRKSSRYPDAWERLEEPIIPDPTIFENLPKGDPGPDALPTTSECAVHLEMLEVFHNLRNQVIQSRDLDKTFKIKPKTRTVYRRKWEVSKFVARSVSLKDDTFPRRRKMKWPYYLHIAVVRFHDWIQMVDRHLKESHSTASAPPKYLLLPPLDVLVVWHAFLLNCSDFKEYCTERKLEHIQDVIFPWAEIHAAINSRHWTYSLPPEHAKWLLESCNMEPSLMNALEKAGRDNPVATTLLSKYHNIVFKFTKGNEHNVDNTTDRQAAFIKAVATAMDDEKLNRPIVENVERQCIFVDKMHAHRWIRSPAVEGTLRRSVDRYDKFLHLFHLYPQNFLVPTLDVDLVWHTHQCSAENYRKFVTERAGRFINHEDKIGRATLDNGFTSTEEWYRESFGEQYQVCLCWSCEAILSAVEEREEEDMLDSVTPDVGALVQTIESRIHYYREVEVSRRTGRRLPIWKHEEDD